MFANNPLSGVAIFIGLLDPESLVDNYGRSGDRGVNFNCPHLEPGQVSSSGEGLGFSE